MKQSSEIRALAKQSQLSNIFSVCKDKRKKFGDCAIRLNLSLRMEEIEQLKQSLVDLDEKFTSCNQSANFRLLGM